MNRVFVYLFFITVGACSPGQCQETNLTLERARAMALDQASIFQQSALDEKIAELEVRIADASFTPRLSAAPGFSYNTPALGVSPAVPSYLGVNGILETTALVTLTGEIDLSGKLHATLARSRALLLQASLNTEAARRALAQATEEAYFALSLAQAQRRNAGENVQDAQSFESLATLRLESGEVPAVDRDCASLQTRVRQDELRQSRNAEEVARLNLAFLVGWSGDTELTVGDLLVDLSTEFQGQSLAESASRPELAALNAGIEATRQDAELPRVEMRPQLSYSLGGGFLTDSLDPQNIGHHLGLQAGIQLQIPISDGGASQARQHQAELAGEKLANQQRLLRRQFDQQFETAREGAQTAWLRMLSDRASLDLAAKVASVSRARYQAGEAPINEVVDAQTSLVTLRQSYFQAAYDYKVALSRLRLGAGLTLGDVRR